MAKKKQQEIQRTDPLLCPRIYTIHDRSIYPGWRLMEEADMGNVVATLQSSRIVTRTLQLQGRIDNSEVETIYNEYFYEGCLVMTKEPFYGDFRDGWSLQIHPSCEGSLERALIGLGLKNSPKRVPKSRPLRKKK